MRKVRDYDAELKALSDKVSTLKARKVQQLGELVTATGADALDLNILVGVLIEAMEANADTKEAWRTKGAAFFQRRGRKGARGTTTDNGVASEAGASNPQG